MTANLSQEVLLFGGSLLLLLGIMLSKVGTRIGVPALLIFLLTGLAFGSSGVGISYNNSHATQFIGTIALSVILFFGGFETKFKEIRPILAPGIVLSTLGVLLTTLLLGSFIYWLGTFNCFTIHLSFPISLLLAATMSSTDSASVFALLRSHNMNLKEGLRPMLEVESGSNDPMAYMLTIALIQYITGDGGDGNWWLILLTFVQQFAIGGLGGYVLGRLSTLFLNKININNSSLYPIMLLCMVFFVFALIALLGGNGYLAVYIMGVLMGNKRLVHKKSIDAFFDGTTWLLQIVLFILLGLYADARSLLLVAPFALLVAVFMILFARPLAVHISMIFFPNISLKGKSLIAWVGLRGAVPIIFATYPIISEVPGANVLFDVVFFVTLLSLLVQGSTLPWVARFLGLDEESKDVPSLFGVEIPQSTGAQMEEREVTADMLTEGNKLMEISLRDEELVILVRRGENYIVPKGPLELQVKDVLLIVSETNQKN